ncbi:MmcB family DNA repair protein [Tritonibacter mobilis]|uniref:MmcB family DNA repair protein n=1 Tax=Tritonibacter mobilis TaxID=379347 RepID=UPI000A4E2376|nr:MmcB family DNA repair protein [Tritonibacter mobilis]
MTHQHLDQDEFDAPTREEAVPPEGDEATLALLQPGQRLARGVSRYLRSMGFASVEEFVPARGLRVDVMALGPKGELWVIECKSSRADFQSDCKWQGYLEWCDRYFWAVDVDFPTDLLPEGTGLILADAYDGEVVRMAPEQKLPPARRKKMIQKFAMDAARRLQRLRDPRPGRDGLLLSPSEGE